MCRTFTQQCSRNHYDIFLIGTGSKDRSLFCLVSCDPFVAHRKILVVFNCGQKNGSISGRHLVKPAFGQKNGSISGRHLVKPASGQKNGLFYGNYRHKAGGALPFGFRVSAPFGLRGFGAFCLRGFCALFCGRCSPPVVSNAGEEHANFVSL